jgi:hypothetical protein
MQLGRIPQVLQSIIWTNLCERLLALPSSNDDQSKHYTILSAVLGIHFLNVPFAQISEVEQLPDVLTRLGLQTPRLAILYALGHEELVNEEGFADSPRDSKELLKFFELLHDQPVREQLPSEPSLNNGLRVQLRSIVLGAEFVIDSPNNVKAVAVAESVLGAIEAFMATSSEKDIFPHAERTAIRLRQENGETIRPSFDWLDDVEGFHAEIVTGDSIEFQDKEALTHFTEFLCKTTLTIATRQFATHDLEAWVKKIAGEERGLARATMLGNQVILGQSLFGSDAKIRLIDFMDIKDNRYECLRNQHWRPNLQTAQTGSTLEPIKRGDGPVPEALLDTSQRKHTERKVYSPIDIPLWNQAGWSGTGYAWPEQQPPFIALLFRDAEAGRKIFADWNSRWGVEDVDDALRVTIVTGIDKKNPHHYAVILGANIDQIAKTPRSGSTFTMVSRINRMTPATPENLSNFLKAFSRFKAFYLVPELLPTDRQTMPEIKLNIRLLKRNLYIRPAWQIGENDQDIVALDDDRDPYIPAHVTDAPVLKAIAARNARKSERTG